MKIALITGASSGIGWATALALDSSGYHIIIAGRRAERLAQLAAQLTNPCQTLVFDVSDYAAAKATFGQLPAEWQAVDVLVNNAGNAHGLAPIYEGDLADWNAMIASNIAGLLYLTRLVSPGMVARQQGHIINIGSIAGKQAYANGAVYSATKAAVDMATQGLRIDLNPFGIRVTAIHPGLVETEFSEVRFKGDVPRAAGIYQGYQPLTAADVAEVIRYTVQAPPHVCLAEILLLPTAQANATLVKRNA